jgi:aminoglycoside phosphotransferase (APT) family kinase protein
LGTVRAAGLPATVESFLGGEWLLARWARRLPLTELVQDLELAAEWLAQFHAQSLLELRPWREEDVERWIDSPLAAYADVFGTTEAEKQLFAQLRRQAREALGLPLPVVWQHWDFSSLNIFRSTRAIGVIDWEDAVPGLPIDDLLYFVTRWLYRTRNAEDESAAARAIAAEAFRQLFFDEQLREPALEAARSAIRSYARSLQLESGIVPLLFAHAWIARAVGRFRHRTAVGTAPAEARDGNRYVTLVGITAEHAEQLARGDFLQS